MLGFSQYMTLHNKSNSQLRAVAQDCYNAIQANPDNPKVPLWHAERVAIGRELDRRDRVRARRRTREELCTYDPLMYPVRQRQTVKRRNYYMYASYYDACVWLANH